MMTKRSVFLAVGGALLFVMAMSATTDARVDVSVGISLPAYTFSAPPPLVVIPGTYAYFAPDADVDIVFYRGYWYRPYQGYWYRARGYNGPWASIAPARVPRVIVELPPDYRHVYREHRRIDYGDFHRNWKKWERNRYWERDERWREGRHGEPHEEHMDRGRHY
jgi:hypothetical protein